MYVWLKRGVRITSGDMVCLIGVFSCWLMEWSLSVCCADFVSLYGAVFTLSNKLLYCLVRGFVFVLRRCRWFGCTRIERVRL